MTEIYLIRHGETLWNLENRFQGKSDIKLTELGEKQGAIVAQRVQNVGFDKLYLSPLSRAKKTGELIGSLTETPFEVADDFCEISFGDFEGYTFKELREKYQWFNDWASDPATHAIPNGVDLEEEVKRFKLLMESICVTHKDQKVGIVTHAGVIRLIVLACMNLPLSYYWKFTLYNTSLTVFKHGKNGFNLERLNDYAHLSNS